MKLKDRVQVGKVFCYNVVLKGENVLELLVAADRAAQVRRDLYLFRHDIPVKLADAGPS